MIIKTENTATKRVGSDDVLAAFDEADADPRPVEFDENGTARVPAPVGEYLAETREAVYIETDERDADER
jgi:hypothetical protein